MEMKKIISALVIGAAAAGIATADLKIDFGQKVLGYAFQYNESHEKMGKGAKRKQLFNIDGYDGAKGTAKLTASGNIFTFYSEVGLNAAADDFDTTVKAMTIKAAVGNFAFTTGWSRSGITNMSIKDPAGGNDKGQMTGAMYKLGSPFKESPLFLSNNQAGFGKDPDNYFGHAKYGFGLGDTLKLNLAAAVMSPHGTNNSNSVVTNANGNVDKTSGNKIREDNTQMGWGVNVNPVIGKIVSVEAFAKGFGHKRSEDGHNFLLGGYANLLCVPILTNAVLGGSVWLDGHDGRVCLEEWNIDLDLAFAIGDRFKLGFNNKFAYKDGLQANSGGVPASKVSDGSEQKCHYLLWDVLSASFALNDTMTILGTVGQQTGFGKKDMEMSAWTFTTLFVYPRLLVNVTSKSSVSAGALVTLDKIGSNKKGGDKMGLSVRVPFTVNIAL